MSTENKHTPESLAHLLQGIAKQLCWGRPVEICTEQQQGVHETLTESARLLNSHASLVAENKRLRGVLTEFLAISGRLDQSATHDGLANCALIAKARAALNPEDRK